MSTVLDGSQASIKFDQFGGKGDEVAWKKKTCGGQAADRSTVQRPRSRQGTKLMRFSHTKHGDGDGNGGDNTE